jgi:hypothetical protein
MVGGVLPPFKLLIDHLSSQWSSLHPIIAMNKNDVDEIPILSDIAFPQLPVVRSNLWLTDLLSFRPSSHPLNDIAIVHIDNTDGTINFPNQNGSGTASNNQQQPVPWLQRSLLDLVGFLTAFLLLIGLLFSILTGDMWATTLFFIYLLHALTSTAVSFTPMISRSDKFNRRVKEDSTPRYAVHTRSPGGKIIFVGRQDTLESWARTAWIFRRTTMRNVLHWSWMLTGSLSAAASVICMVRESRIHSCPL